MNKKKHILWGAIVAAVIFVFNLLHAILGGHRGFVGGPHGGPGRGFSGYHHVMDGPHFGGGFPWLTLLIGLAVLVLLVGWLRKKSRGTYF